MPELPEVETVARSLRPFLVGRKILAFKDTRPGVLDNISAASFKKKVKGRTVRKVSRRAKYLVLELDAGFILIHLRMTGKLYPLDKPPRDLRHISAYVTFDRDTVLIFKDTRKFGRFYFYPDESAYNFFSRRFGPEPLTDNFTLPWLKNNLTRRNRMIKPLLLDQEFIAGLGNIYVDEALWHARIHPATPAIDIDKRKIAPLYKAIRLVLEESIHSNGTTFMDFKFLGGQEGGYTEHLRVFGRQGENCPRCKKPIDKILLGQRGTHFCPFCQSPPKTTPVSDAT